MKVISPSRIPPLPLVALWVTYVLLGWYLSFYHIFWFVGALIAAAALALSWKSLVWVERFFEFASTSLLVILAILMLCVSLALATAWTALIPIIALPLPVTFWANVEMRFAGFSRLNTFLLLAAIAGFGLGFGEIIDILFLSSIRY